MVSAVYSTPVVSRRCSCQIRQRWLSARHTCSIVISGFSPPKPIRVFGDKSHHDQAQYHVPQQPYITAPLKMGKADLALGHAKGVLHVPARESHTQQFLDRRVGGRVRKEVL